MENRAIANDYINSIQNSGNALENQITPLCSNIEEMMAHLEEFENLLTNIKSDSNEIIKSNIPQILAFKPTFNQLCQRIDNMEKLINLIESNVDELDEVIEIARNELNVKEYSLKSLLAPLFRKSPDIPKTNLNLNGEFQRPKIFKTSDFIISTNGNDQTETS